MRSSFGPTCWQWIAVGYTRDKPATSTLSKKGARCEQRALKYLAQKGRGLNLRPLGWAAIFFGALYSQPLPPPLMSTVIADTAVSYVSMLYTGYAGMIPTYYVGKFHTSTTIGYTRFTTSCSDGESAAIPKPRRSGGLFDPSPWCVAATVGSHADRKGCDAPAFLGDS